MYATLVSIKNIVQWKQHTFIPFSFFTPSFSASEQNFVPWDIFPALETHLALTLFLTFLHKKALLQCTSSYLTGDRQVKSYCHVTMMQKRVTLHPFMRCGLSIFHNHLLSLIEAVCEVHSNDWRISLCPCFCACKQFHHQKIPEQCYWYFFRVQVWEEHELFHARLTADCSD